MKVTHYLVSASSDSLGESLAQPRTLVLGERKRIRRFIAVAINPRVG